MQAEHAWKATLGELELQLTKATFNTWLKDARLLSAVDNCYVISVRNAYAKDWLENRLHDTIQRTLTAIQGTPVELEYVIGQPAATAATNGMAPASLESTGQVNGVATNGATQPAGFSNGKSNGLSRSNGNGHHPNGQHSNGQHSNGNLRPHYTFDTFVVGSSNRLAHAAALSVSEHPGQYYNPLFIYGGVGLGKTHLLHAVGHRCQAAGYTVCYVTSETFTNELIQSIRNQRTAEFRDKYRTPDVLLIDDIQFIAGKESTQEEMFHTFNDLHSLGKQLILSSDRPPKAMVTLEERLRSRFEWGLMADVQSPNTEMRMAILQQKAEQLDVRVPTEVIEFVAHQVRSNIRELEGVLTKVIAFANITGSPIDMPVVQTALADIVRKPDKVTIDSIVEMVAGHYGITVESLLGAGRSRKVAFPRQMCMYLARTETDASFPQIGQKLGNRDHSTILYGHDKIAQIVETDPEVRRDMLTIKNKLYQASIRGM